MKNRDVRRSANQLRTIPLVQVLELVGAEQDSRDKERWLTTQGILSVTGNKFFNWSREVGGGGAIDLVIHLEELRFMDAIEWLSHRFHSSSSPSPPAEARPEPSMARPLRLPHSDSGKILAVTRCLVHNRNLDLAMINSLIDSGVIYADGKSNAVFVMREDGGGRSIGAELRGTTDQPWRGMAPGSNKNLGYFSIGISDPETIILCESAIDALSCFTLHPQSLCISTAGARPNPSWLTPLLHRRPNVVRCGFDADPAGDHAAAAMLAMHPQVRRLRPRLNDWNDVLRA